MNRIALTICTTLLCLTGLAQQRGDLKVAINSSSYSRSTIRQIYQLYNISEEDSPLYYDVDVYQIEYYTPEPKQEYLTVASGLIFVPQGDSAFDLLSYQHGTAQYGSAPPTFANSAYYLGLPFATNGFLTIMPDYVGYGSTPDSIPHAYLHSESEATSVIDMLRATRIFCTQNNIELNDKLFLAGYSQGGHVTMATHKAIQENYNEEFEVTASASGAGPYELTNIMRDSALYSPVFSNPFYISFVVESYDYVYDVYDAYSDVYIHPYDTIAPEVFDRSSPRDVNDLAWPGYSMLQPDVFDSLAEGTHPINEAFEANELFNWVPLSPVNLYYCEADDQVPYTISLFTADTMKKLGAENVNAISVNPFLDHSDCGIPAMTEAKLWFDAFRGNSVMGVNQSSKNLSFYPNPAEDFITIEDESNSSYKIFTTNGLLIKEGKIVDGQIDVADLTEGNYILSINNMVTGFVKN